MASDNNNFFNTSLLEQDVKLAALRKGHKKLTLIFKLFFITLTLIISALFIYLVQDITSDWDQSIPPLNPISNQTTDHESLIFDTLSLQRAAKELEDLTSFILYNYIGSNIDTNTEFAINNCWRSLKNGSARIQEALDNESRSVEIMNTVLIEAEENIETCIDDLEKVGSTAGIEVRARVLRAKVHLRGRGDFLMSYVGDFLRKVLTTVAAAWDRVCLFIVCVGGMQLLFIFYLLWTLTKFR